MNDDLRHFRHEPDAFDLELSPGEFAVIIACAIAFGALISL